MIAMSGRACFHATDEQRLEQYLHEQVAAANGQFYFESKFIADDGGVSPSKIGTLVATLQNSVQDLEIQQWAYTNATTWRVTLESDT